ncbi:MAG: hypothetical protein AAB433_08625, partial [Nitrospirota bacterium]
MTPLPSSNDWPALLAMPAGARLLASDTWQFNLKEQIHALKTQQGITLESMAQALRTFHERTTILDTFQALFPQHARQAIQKAMIASPAHLHEHLLETMMPLVNTHHFPVDEWDIVQVLDTFPMIPIAAINFDEESELEEEYLATRIAATMTGYYSNAPSWKDIQQVLGSAIQVPSCFTDSQHNCRVNFGIFSEHCQQHRPPVSDFPTILRIMYHDTGTLFLDISYCNEVPDHGYTWTKQDIHDLTEQWTRAQQLTKTWIRTAKRLDAQPR